MKEKNLTIIPRSSIIFPDIIIISICVCVCVCHHYYISLQSLLLLYHHHQHHHHHHHYHNHHGAYYDTNSPMYPQPSQFPPTEKTPSVPAPASRSCWAAASRRGAARGSPRRRWRCTWTSRSRRPRRRRCRGRSSGCCREPPGATALLGQVWPGKESEFFGGNSRGKVWESDTHGAWI